MNDLLQHMVLGYERLLKPSMQKGWVANEEDIPQGIDSSPRECCLAFDSS